VSHIPVILLQARSFAFSRTASFLLVILIFHNCTFSE
jgi:hypothetical protein